MLAETHRLGFNEYQDATARHDRSPGTDWYYTLGLTGEAGEVAEIIKKANRLGDWHKPVKVNDLKLELGDVLWHIARLGTRYGITLQDIAESNIAKLDARHLRG